MAVDAHALDIHSQQRFADTFDDFPALRVEHFEVAAKQDFARQTKRPAFFGQFKALLFEYGDLRRSQAFLRRRLATAQRQHDEQDAEAEKLKITLSHRAHGLAPEGDGGRKRLVLRQVLAAPVLALGLVHRGIGSTEQ